MTKRSGIKPRLGDPTETRLFEKLFEEPERFRKRLLLAIALSPPKSRKAPTGRPGLVGMRRKRR